MDEEQKRFFEELTKRLERLEGRNNQQRPSSSSSSSSGSSSSNFGAKARDEAGKFAENVISGAGAGLSNELKSIGQKIPVFGDAIGLMSGAILETDDTFRNLSKVGAGFNGNLGELRMGAAMTNMRLGDFANLVGNNSELLAGFAGGVQGGVKAFRNLSFAMTSGPQPLIKDFQNLGFSLEEANEFVLENLEFQRRDARFRRADGSMNSEMMLQSSLQMAKSLDVMAKVAGKELKQMQNDVIERGRVGATQARLRLLEQQGIANAGETYTKVQTELQAGPKVLQDLFADVTQLGVPLSDSTKAFAATNKEAYKYAQEYKAALQRGDTTAATEAARKAVAATAQNANSTQGLTLATMQQVSNIAEVQAGVLEETGPLIDQIKAKTGAVGTEVGNLETFIRGYNKIISEQISKQTQQTAGAGPGQQLQQTLAEIDRMGREASEKINTTVSAQMESNVKMNNALRDGLGEKGLAGVIKDAVSNINNTLKLLPGVAEANNQSMSVEQKVPLLGPQEQAQIRVVNDASQPLSVRNDALALLKEKGLITNDGLKIVDIDLTKSTGKALGGSVFSNMVYKVGEQGPETFVPNMDGAIIPNMKTAINRMPDMINQLMGELQNTGVPVTQAARTAAANMQEEFSSGNLEQKLDTLNQTMLQLLSINTNTRDIGNKQVRAMRSAGNLMGGLSIR